MESTTETKVNPWERMDGETESSWAAFRIYRDLPPTERTLLAAWYDYRETKDGVRPDERVRPPGFIQTWSAKNSWSVRVQAYDRHNDVKTIAHSERDHLAKLSVYRDRLVKYSEISTRNAIASMVIIERTLTAMNEAEGIIEPRVLPKFIQATAKLFETAAEQESRALAVDSLLEVLGSEGKLQELH